ncbi:MAG: heme biosynthesis protein HemY [Azonexus sp.]|uniref:heme biosynthesis HemY N-terminal domain-containing protein n=1 Tax=Azonexus sp. TaxID=1872668 RepID=UPI0028378061|nr:heme biosynthesis HemY N-terminal domain-containing protein [Azonexus sp.]MDR0776638.1 heme biosynthesis protein HemY [Azonexus sp.]
MRGLFWLLALFAAAAAVAVGARMNDGYVLLVLPPYRAEVTLNLFLLALVLLFLLAYGALRALFFTFSLPERARRFRQRRRRERASQVFQDAVRLLFEGRFGQALKKAGEAHATSAAPGLSALIAARAAQRLREPEKQQDWMDKAKASDPRTEAATLMLEAEMMNEGRHFNEALQALARLQDKQGRHIAALRLELRARQGIGDWDGVLKLLRQLVKRDALSPQVAREARSQAHLGNIARLAGDSGSLIAYLRTLPAEERSQRVVLAAARALVAGGAGDEAQKPIEAAFEATPHDEWLGELLSIYGSLADGDQFERIARAEAWLQQYPADARLLQALGRMCRRQRLWGKAQSYLEASLAIAPTQQAHLELAHLFDQLDRSDDANRHYRASTLLEAG